jgi:hypothetical protein
MHGLAGYATYQAHPIAAFADRRRTKSRSGRPTFDMSGPNSERSLILAVRSMEGLGVT